MMVDKTQRLDTLPIVCVDCGKLTNQQEARLRLFRSGYCAYCGGTLTLDASTLLDHDLPDDARQLIEAALEAER